MTTRAATERILSRAQARGRCRPRWGRRVRATPAGGKRRPSLRVATRTSGCGVTTPRHTVKVWRRRCSLHPSPSRRNAASCGYSDRLLCSRMPLRGIIRSFTAVFQEKSPLLPDRRKKKNASTTVPVTAQEEEPIIQGGQPPDVVASRTSLPVKWGIGSFHMDCSAEHGRGNQFHYTISLSFREVEILSSSGR